MLLNVTKYWDKLAAGCTGTRVRLHLVGNWQLSARLAAIWTVGLPAVKGLFFIFLAVPHGMRDPSSPTRD